VRSLESELELSVWQKSSKGKPELLGRVFLTLFDLKEKKEIDSWHTLDHHSRKSHISGQVHVKVKYHDPNDYSREEEDIAMVRLVISLLFCVLLLPLAVAAVFCCTCW